MKYLFLDIDGVLNCFRHDDWPSLRPELVARFLGWHKGTDVKIVLSSFWRMDLKLCYMLNMAGVTWVDITPNMSAFGRSNEIEYWVSTHPHVKHYAILDDMDHDFSAVQKRHFVQVDRDIGLASKDIAKLNTILGLPSKG